MTENTNPPEGSLDCRLSAYELSRKFFCVPPKKFQIFEQSICCPVFLEMMSESDTGSTQPSLSDPSKLSVRFRRSLTNTHTLHWDKKKQWPDCDYHINNSLHCLQSITLFTLTLTAILLLSVPCLCLCPCVCLNLRLLSLSVMESVSLLSTF